MTAAEPARNPGCRHCIGDAAPRHRTGAAAPHNRCRRCPPAAPTGPRRVRADPPAAWIRPDPPPSRCRGEASRCWASPAEAGAGRHASAVPPMRRRWRAGPRGPDRAAGGRGGGRRATGVRPARTPPGSRCQGGCRGTAGTAGGASRSDRDPRGEWGSRGLARAKPQTEMRAKAIPYSVSRNPPGEEEPSPLGPPGDGSAGRAGPAPAPLPAAAAPECGCGASGRACWWGSRGAAPGRAHRATPAAAPPGALGRQESCAGCRGAGARRLAGPARGPTAPASQRWDRRRGRPRRATRGHPGIRKRPATGAGTARSPPDRRPCRSGRS